ncbi:hypothetical protein M404DRAFT_600383 [Pisolithus tinctorius Marx 270]|uniref:Uncharacterized protein n=1 Tax=Pisolithus tinctorius Marx 270 TaxID=870435 RepID=A0A0C3J4Q5_PISTI|nr:hypothetical protein M404DRAFT_600383 [Pisolithus tinctorius Marx 270]
MTWPFFSTNTSEPTLGKTMPPKRKREETEAGVATRSTRKSTRTGKNQDNVNTSASFSSAETESAPSKKARSTTAKTTGARSRSSRAVNDDRLVSTSTNPDKNASEYSTAFSHATLVFVLLFI